MTSAVPQRHSYTFRDYLHVEEMSPLKHEYLDGEIYVMAGSTLEHAALCASLLVRLHGLTAGQPCRVFGSDLGVRVLASGMATYPDVSVVCGAVKRDPESPTHYNNPVIVCEVLSPSTEHYDRGEKREHYQQLDSLREYVIIAQDRPLAEMWTRGRGGVWNHEVIAEDGEIVLESLGGSIRLRDLYSDAGL